MCGHGQDAAEPAQRRHGVAGRVARLVWGVDSAVGVAARLHWIGDVVDDPAAPALVDEQRGGHDVNVGLPVRGGLHCRCAGGRLAGVRSGSRSASLMQIVDDIGGIEAQSIVHLIGSDHSILTKLLEQADRLKDDALDE